MTKQELIDTFKKILSTCDELNELNDTYVNLSEWIELCEKGRYKPDPPEYHAIRPGRIVCFFLYIAITGAIGFLIGRILKWLLLDVFNNSVLHIISIVIQSIVWIFLTYAIYSANIENEKKEHQNEVDDVKAYNDQLTKAKNDYLNNYRRRQQIQEQIVGKQRQYCMLKEKVGGLHKRFCKRSTVNSLISILEEGRADTLKEALNVYLADEREYARDEAEREYRREQNELQRQILAEQQYQSDMAAQSAEESARAAANLDALNQRESWREFERIIGIR